MTSSAGISHPGLGASPPPALQTFPQAVTSNVAIARTRTRSRIMAVVKADGYGHRAITVAQAAIAAGAEWLGTTDIAEASKLRAAGLTVPILTWLNPSGVEAEAAATDPDRRRGRLRRRTGGPAEARRLSRLTDDGPVLDEVNTMPGMTAESQVPRMFAAAGVPYEDLVARLIDAATVPAARLLADEWPKPDARSQHGPGGRE